MKGKIAARLTVYDLPNLDRKELKQLGNWLTANAVTLLLDAHHHDRRFTATLYRMETSDEVSEN